MRHVRETGAESAAGVSSAGYLRRLVAEEGGSISVERFMQEALYHPQFGYYARRVGTVGRSGDFSTSATLHPALGQAVAAWLLARRRELGWRGAWHCIELGGGTGELAVSVLQALGWWRRRGLRYHLVEVSRPLRAQQQARLGQRGGVLWHDDIRSALAAAQGKALIFSNEFVDAFPCVQLTWDAGAEAWREVRVTWPEGAEKPREITVPWPGVVPATDPFDSVKAGQRIEIHASYARWLQSWAEVWCEGRMLTIDYGDEWPTLYDRQPRGTLRAYCRHQRFTGPEVYERFGQQDLTADVNFTDLQAWGREAGLETLSFGNQADFLRRWLAARSICKPEDARLNFLLDTDGAGGAFKVLEQRRG